LPPNPRFPKKKEVEMAKKPKKSPGKPRAKKSPTKPKKKKGQ
jgi:hypothetical protein